MTLNCVSMTEINDRAAESAKQNQTVHIDA